MVRRTARSAPLTSTADILRGHADRDTAALFFEDRSWTYRELVAEACRRAPSKATGSALGAGTTGGVISRAPRWKVM